MNWINENKFLAAFFGVMIVGVGALGFLYFSASGRYTDAAERYEKQSADYKRLRSLPLYPNDKNLKALVAQKSEAEEVITAFEADLAKQEFPLTPMTPEAFQEKLKVAVTAISARASESGIELPKEFFLGFEIYNGRPPSAEAAPALGRQLKAIEWVVNLFITNRIIALTSIKRYELPEEKRGGRSEAPARKGEKAAKELVMKHPFDISVTCRSNAFTSTLNTIVSDKAPQFYIPRLVRVTNKEQKGPPRGQDLFPPPAPPQPDGQLPADPPPPAPAKTVNYIVGEETFEVFLRLEAVNFADVTPK